MNPRRFKGLEDQPEFLPAPAARRGASRQRESGQEIRIEEAFARLDALAVGQADYKKSLISAAAWVFLSRHSTARSKPCVLAKGPTGSGKTFIASEIANLCGLPFAQASAPDLAPTGIGRGQGVTAGILSAIALQNPGRTDLQQGGLFFLDEIDKLAASDQGDKDATASVKLSVQKELLSPIHGTVGRVAVGNQLLEIDLSRWVFVAAGAFQGLDAQVARRIDRLSNPLGFHARTAGQAEARLTPADFVAYGLLPELMGRFPVLVSLESMTQADLEKILRESTQSPTRELRAHLALMGLELEWTPCAYTAIAEKALASGLGVRALTGVVETMVGGQLRIFGSRLAQDGITHIRIAAATIREGHPPDFIQGTRVHQPVPWAARPSPRNLPPALAKLFAPGELPKRPARSQASWAHGGERLASVQELQRFLRRPRA